MALLRVCLTDKETPITNNPPMPSTLNRFINVFGHLEHLLSPDQDQVGMQPWHKYPWYPSAQSPFGLKFGSIIPLQLKDLHASSFERTYLKVFTDI